MSPTAKTAAKTPRSAASRRAKKAPDGAVATLALRWTGDLDLTRAAALHGELREAFAGATAIDLTLDEIGNLDLSCVQLLISATRTAARDGKSFRVHCTADRVRDVWQQAGLEAEYDQLFTHPAPAAEVRS